MHWKSFRLVLVTASVILFAVACGGGKTAKKTTAPKTTTPTPAKLSFKATLTATSHHPVVNKNWFITVTVTDLSGKPIAATLRMNVLLGSLQVGKIDNGKTYHFVSRHHENITWPAAAVGHQLTLQAVVKAKGKTKTLLWPLSVVRK
jgi:hypothetical protein